MVDYEAQNWVAILLRVRGSVLPRLVIRVLLAAAFGAAAVAAHVLLEFRIDVTAHALIGVALGLLLVFRTNASYDRFWEGRKLVGQLVIATRDLMRQIVTYVDDTGDHRIELRRKLLAFYYLAVQRLREEDDLESLRELLTDREREALRGVTHRAPVMLTWVSARLARLAAHADPMVSEIRLSRVDQNIQAMNAALVGCERIRFTPVPFAYAQHIKVFLTLFCYTAPFAMVNGMSYWTPLAAAMLALALFGIDEIGVEIEDPFGVDPNDLPLEAIGESLERATAEMLDSDPDAAVADGSTEPQREPGFSLGATIPT
ncbi:MAG: bestrophin family protein [Sandaracinaceae bacterium]